MKKEDLRKLRQKKRYKRMYFSRLNKGSVGSYGMTKLLGMDYYDGSEEYGNTRAVGDITGLLYRGHTRPRIRTVVSRDSETTVFLLGVVVIMVCLVMSLFSGCSIVLSGGAAMLAGTFPGTDEDIWGVDDEYRRLEDKLDDQINRMESTHPDMDEYCYQVDEITHNPFQLAALLSALYGSYTYEDVRDVLPEILNHQYSLSVREKTEIRTREVRDPVTGDIETEEYEYRILYVSLTNHGLDHAAKQMLSDEQYALYEAYSNTRGNRKELFDENTITINPQGGANGGESYQVSQEALSDEQFRRMITEAEKYLGYPYVWGGSTPATSFDCSGFVSWVINHCSNGWNVGRQTAEGLRRLCTPVPVSEAKPGDLIFFQGTYNTSGASHIGIYVGNGMMIHAGKPIQYSNVNTPYFREHFFQYGRLP